MRAFLFECLCNALLPMADTYLYAKLLMDMLCKMLGGIDTAMLTAGTAEREHQRRKATLDITPYMRIGQFVDTIQERKDFTVIFQETDHGLIQSRQLLIRLITAGVMRAAAIEHIPSPIA